MGKSAALIMQMGQPKLSLSLQAQHILIVSRASRQQPSRKEKNKDGSYVARFVDIQN
jgi:hypothetical protein